jgi:hypothetical protein
MMVPGYEHQTLECLACHEIERRLVFARGPSQGTIPASSPSAQDEDRNSPQIGGGEPSPVIAPIPSASVQKDKNRRSPQHEVGRPSPAIAPISSAAQQHPRTSPRGEGGAASSTWERAIEKLHKRQVDLIERAELAKKTDGYRPPPPAKQLFRTGKPNRLNGSSWPQNRERRTVIAVQAMVQVVARHRHHQAKREALRDDPEVRRFDEFWDSLVPSRSPPTPIAKSSAQLPVLRPVQSTSLVPVEVGEPRSLCARAIAMLRGRDVSTVQPGTSDILNGGGYNANGCRSNEPL